ncbi:hypothetical protein INR49_004862 [Caranx melampygus]|nr:hypothetical protein INR49_004862 [Caranx melampygus]
MVVRNPQSGFLLLSRGSSQAASSSSSSSSSTTTTSSSSRGLLRSTLKTYTKRIRMLTKTTYDLSIEAKLRRVAGKVTDEASLR